jgi:hypothetical protein
MNTSFIMQYAQLEKQAVSEPDADLWLIRPKPFTSANQVRSTPSQSRQSHKMIVLSTE